MKLKTRALAGKARGQGQEHSLVDPAAVESKRCVLGNMFVLQGDRHDLDPGRLEAAGMDGHDLVDRAVEDEVVCSLRSEIEADVHAHLDQDSVTKC